MSTLKKISELSGVSINTVSRVLNGYNKENRPSSIAKAKRIRELAQELGYMPNTAAKAIRDGSFKTIMLLQSELASFGVLSNEVVYSIHQVLSERGYKLLLSVLPESLDSEDEAPAFFRESCVDGVLIAINRNIPQWLDKQLEKLKIPKVWIGSDQKGNCVCHNDQQSAYDAVKKLVHLGHKKIVYADITSPLCNDSLWHFSTVERLEGYHRAMNDAGLAPIAVRPAEKLDMKTTVDYAWSEILCKHKPTAIVAYGMQLTGSSILYACCRHGISIPKDLSFFTWGEEPIENGLEISCYTPSPKGIGKKAATMMLDLINHPQKTKKPLRLSFNFTPGSTIAKPSRNSKKLD